MQIKITINDSFLDFNDTKELQGFVNESLIEQLQKIVEEKLMHITSGKTIHDLIDQSIDEYDIESSLSKIIRMESRDFIDSKIKAALMNRISDSINKKFARIESRIAKSIEKITQDFECKLESIVVNL